MKVKIIRLCTQIHGVSKLDEIEKILNNIGAENIISITAIDVDLIVVYKTKGG